MESCPLIFAQKKLNNIHVTIINTTYVNILMISIVLLSMKGSMKDSGRVMKNIKPPFSLCVSDYDPNNFTNGLDGKLSAKIEDKIKRLAINVD